MKVARTLIAITLSLVFGSSLVLAQVTAPEEDHSQGVSR